MNSVRKMSKKDLSALITKASKELESRKREELIIKEIQKVLEKHGLNGAERSALIKLLAKSVAPSSRTRKRTNKTSSTRRARVKPKYQEPLAGQKWTGRGRAPNWVAQLCEKKGISLDDFKASSDFLI